MRRSEIILQKGSFEAIPCEEGFLLKRQLKKDFMVLRVFTPKIGGPDSFTLTKNDHNY